MSTLWIGIIGKATVLLAAAWALSFALRRASAAIRHLVWGLALASMLLLPAASLLIPIWQVPLPQVASATQIVVRAASRASTVTPPASGVPWIPLVWITGALVVLTRLVIATARVAWKASRAKPVTDPAWTGLLDLDRRATLLCGGPSAMPMTWGLWRPVIFLPDEANDLSPEQRRMVLLHELAHVKRRDCLTQALAQVACALYWFHPLAWLALRRLQKEREQACDDFVLNAGQKPSEYAEYLLETARALRPAGPAPAVAMARRSGFEGRLLAILDHSPNRRPLSRRSLAGAAVVATGLVVVLAGVRPLLHAAEPEGIAGTVYDPSGAVVPGVDVAVLNLDTSQKTSVTTGPVGEFQFPQLAPSNYQLIVSAPGFRAYFQRVPFSGKPVRLEAILDPGSVSESIKVRARGTAAKPGPQRIRVGGNVVPSRQLESSPPVYPERARAAGIEGTVLIRAVILESGSLSSPIVLSSPDSDLTAAALDAISRWRYAPTMLNGHPVETVTTVTVKFELEE